MTEQEIMNLSGYDLDHAVAAANNWMSLELLKKAHCTILKNKDNDSIIIVINDYHPSTNGTQCMEIMKREKISVTPCEPDLWEAKKIYKQEKGDYGMEDIFYLATGNTPNEAILRCFLLSKQ